jgi:MraZ protein
MMLPCNYGALKVQTMRIFLSQYSSKLDDKHRVSIPSAFRNVLKEVSREGSVFVYRSFINECIEVCTQERMLQLYEQIEELDMFSPERDAIATAILSGSEQLQVDSKGRVSLPDQLLEFAEIKDEALFVGKGDTFEIWSKAKFQPYYQAAREAAMQKKLVLRKKA